jgi:hypothetical protein
VVDFPVDGGANYAKAASKRLAIWLRLGVFAFAGVIIIPLFILGRQFNVPEIECSDVVVQSSLIPLGIPVGEISEPQYQIVVCDISIRLPPTLTKMFMKGSRCGQP